MFVRSLTCAVLLLAGATTAQETTEEGFMTIQTSIPSETEGESTSACYEVCVVEPCTQCPLTNPLRTSETIPQLIFCHGVYTTSPCPTVTGEMSIPVGETPIPSSELPSSTGGSASEGGSTTPGASFGSSSPSPTRTPTSSSSNSVAPATSTPGAASSISKGDGNFIWVAALSALGFAWTLV